MTRQEIFDKLKEIIHDSLQTDHAITEDSYLRQDIGCDSLDIVLLMMKVDDTFAIDTSETSAELYDTIIVKDIIDIIEVMLTAENTKRDTEERISIILDKMRTAAIEDIEQQKRKERLEQLKRQ